MEQETHPKPGMLSQRTYAIRRTIAFAVVLAVSVYIVGIVLGRVPAQQKLGATDVGVLVVTAVVARALVRPEFLDRLTHIKLWSFEADWRELKDKQQTQEKELDDVRLILTLLVQGAEQSHLKNLEKGAPVRYHCNHNVRSELRRLRTLGLIQNRKDRAIKEMIDGRDCDLTEIVQLTERGKQYLERIREQELGSSQ